VNKGVRRGFGQSAPPIFFNRILWGKINADGTIAMGTGFKSVRNSTGQYTITPDVPFAVTPMVICTSQQSSSHPSGAQAIGTTSFGLHAEVPNVSFQDEPIAFIAFEPTV